MTAPANKDQRIHELLDAVARSLPAGSWQTIDHWEADRLAIGIASPSDPRRLVYVTVHREPAGRFTYQLESPTDGPSPKDFKAGEMLEHVAIDEVIAAIRVHLER